VHCTVMLMGVLNAFGSTVMCVEVPVWGYIRVVGERAGTGAVRPIGWT
jgi:hypothetical protein